MLYFLLDEHELNLIYDTDDMSCDLNFGVSSEEIKNHLKESETLGRIFYFKTDINEVPLLGDCILKFIDENDDPKIQEFLETIEDF
jgi:hypothetical protein